MDFTNKLEEIETTLEDTSLPESNTQMISQDKEIMTVAQISPAASITMSWSMVEKEIMNTINRSAISSDYPPYNSSLKNIQLLKDIGKIDSDTLNSLNELRILRNKAAHGHLSNENLTFQDAMTYYSLSLKVITILEKIND
ncbi:DUF4145 domain-containing protein [Metaplanococcus flavidus]|uniref:DUF4145 domain-containing protein n=1 Tax=Metaplanococcus flavidus TaxID=569883 RepID=A0ABW3LEY5_9BACL